MLKGVYNSAEFSADMPLPLSVPCQGTFVEVCVWGGLRFFREQSGTV